MANPRNIDATEGDLVKKSLLIAWPAVLQAILVNFYAFNDFFFIGLLDNPAATAALSACFAILVVNYTLLNMIATGSTTLIAQYFGRRQKDKLASILRQAITSEILWGALIGLLGLALLPLIISMSNVTPAVGAEIDGYLSVIYWTSPFFALMLVVIGAFRACGNTRVPLVLEVASLLINVLLNYLLVLGPGPLPSLGVAGAAVATGVSRGIPGVIGLWLIFRGGLDVDLHRAEDGERSWLPTPKVLGAMFRIGIFSSISGAIYGTVYFILNRMAGEIGPAAQGGLGAGLRGIEWIGFAFGDGFFAASIAMVGQNLGADKPKRAFKGALLNAGLSALSCQLVGFGFLLAPEQLTAIVTGDPQTLAYGAEYVRTIGWVMWAVGFEMAMYGAFVGAGQTRVTMAISGTANLLRVPLVAWFLFGPEMFGEGVLWSFTGLADAPPIVGTFSAIANAIAITAVLKAIVFTIYLLWRRGFAERVDVFAN
ncbi:MATE family efflux transporter [Persicimonas caeni]|uniref:Multidrug-efflux transporter n=1 Tax=Persicimonas caeni TaxID=2292766 RepID=A0A4Y6PNS5_PERCE|nr:MATE family efflux transporter [Persicimonas caeni]QDG49455.1 MATE family efflux transporter [Persicimonas caeni]QED30676.1 MATE family efflux transporter [Persicimonas caeni]